jgi:flagellar motor switch protein FliM
VSAKAVLTSIEMPASKLLTLSVGDVLPLPEAKTDRVLLVADGKQALFAGKLGEIAQVRALRLDCSLQDAEL